MSETDRSACLPPTFDAGGRGSIRLAILLGAVTAFAPFATDMYLGSLGDVARSLAVDAGSVQITVSTFFAGMAAGQFFYGPAIDRWGRKGPLLVGIVLFTLASALLVVAPDLHSFVALRFVEAMGGSAGMIIARAVIRDVYDLQSAAAMLGQMMLVQGLGPVLAPIIGAGVVAFLSWQWIFVLLAASGIFWFVAIWKGLPETLPPEERHIVGPRELLTVFAALARRPDFVLPAAVAAAAMGSIFAFIGGSSFVFMERFGLSREAYSLIFGANALGMIVAAQANRLLLMHFRPRTLVVGATLFGSVAALVLVAVSDTASWRVLLAPIFLTQATCPVIGANAQAIAMARSGEHAGTASSLVGIVQYLFAGTVIAAVGLLHDGTVHPMAGMMALCLTSSLALAIVARRRGAI